MKKIHRITTALLLSMILVIGGGERCSAGVNDNVLNSGLELKVGEPSNDGETIFSLLHQILTELAYVRNAVTSNESVSNADLKELIIGNYSSDKLCTQPTIVEARGYNNHLTVTWTKPTTTNVAVAKYNVYICPSDTAPLDLTDFTKIGTVAYNEFENNFTYVSPELLPNVNYWVMVTSESKRGVNNDQLVLNGSHIMKCVDKSAIASNIFTITEENDTITSCYTTQTFNYILNIPETINGKTVVGVGSPNGNSATVAAGNFRDILIPDTITQVNSYFLNSKNACMNLGISKDNCDSFNRYDKLPDAVTDVGDYAFNAETGLKDSNRILPTSLVNIGAYAYSNTKIATVKFTENTLQRIGNSAFENCTQINTVYVPNILEFGEIAFKGCTGLINLECNATTLTTQFQNCPALSNIVLDELVATVQYNAFYTNIGTVNQYCIQRAYAAGSDSVYYNIGGVNQFSAYSVYRYASNGGSVSGTPSYSYALDGFNNLVLGQTSKIFDINERRSLFCKGNTVFNCKQNVSTSSAESTYAEGSRASCNYNEILFIGPFLPTFYYWVVCSGNRFYDCSIYESYWHGGNNMDAAFASWGYNIPNASNGVFCNIAIYSANTDICDSSAATFSADKYTQFLRSNTILKTSWLADQFIEQHDINDVDVPSFK